MQSDDQLARRIHALDPSWRLEREGSELVLYGNGAPAAWRSAVDCESWIVAQEEHKKRAQEDRRRRG
jgi:hypothetical protein